MKKAAYDACWRGMPLDRRGDWAWEVLHLFRHSPIPFTEATLVDRVRSVPTRADFAETEARDLIRAGLDWKWIIPVDEKQTMFRGNAKPKKK